MKWAFDIIMEQRARGLFRRIAPHLPDAGTIADVGSGTGHNAEQIRRRTSLIVNEFDVVDLHWVGPGPALISGDSIPAGDRSYAVLLLMFVVQYPETVSHLLREARRVTQGSVVVLQSTYRGALGLLVLRIREFFWGYLALRIAITMKLISRVDRPLLPRHFFTRNELIEEFRRSGLTVRELHESNGFCWKVSRDLFVLEAIAP